MDLQVLMETALHHTLQALGVKIGAIWLLPTQEEESLFALRGITPAEASRLGQKVENEMVDVDALRAVNDWLRVPDPSASEVTACGIRASVAVPLPVGGQPIGRLAVATDQPRSWSGEATDLLESIARHLAIVIERSRIFGEMQERTRQMELLYRAGLVLNQSLDRSRLMDALLDISNRLVPSDQTHFYRIDPQHRFLRLECGIGYTDRRIEETLRAWRFPVGEREGITGLVAQTRQPAYVPDVKQDPRWMAIDTSTHSAFWVPVEHKGNLLGVLSVRSRRPHAFTPADRQAVGLMANQLGVALANSLLFSDLEQSNQELQWAYDTTLEGRTHAMDLRDKETEGHTQRVAELAEKLARAMGIGEEELVHVVRGALLHDIGKMGIPDQILLKPGPLTDEEWAIMRQHPVHAFDLLSPISYLRLAVDIPYCHHEKWDGSGYPRRLKGEQIPLAARIFAVVDVWDALTSDRPYRAALERDEALDQISSGSGSQFDPNVVDAFLNLIAAL